MTSPIPIVGNTSSTSGTTPTPVTPQPTANNTLGPDSFITLLTAQLQAQDPLSPMDPDQMVNELTSINTLQQIIQMRTDMDTLVGALPQGQSGTGTGSGSGTSSVSGSGSSTGSTTGTSSFRSSAVPSAAKLNYLVNSQVNSQINSNSQSY